MLKHLYTFYLSLCLVSIFVLTAAAEEGIPRWLVHTCGCLYGSFLFKHVIEGTAPDLAFWKESTE